MSSPPGAAPTTTPTPAPTSAPVPPRRDGGGTGLVALGLLAIGAAAVFWAGLSLGSGPSGRNDQERAAIAAFTETYQRIADDFVGSPPPDALVEGAIKGMFSVLDDPYSRYMSPDEFAAALDDARGEFEGIGAVMESQGDDGAYCAPIDEGCRLRVLEVLDGAPAQAAGLLVGDAVVAVDGTSLEGSTIDDAVGLIRGPRGSQVTLTVDREGTGQELRIRRDTVITEDVHASTLADGRVGYLLIDSFSANAATDFAVALERLVDDGIEGLILDLRDDPGGLVDAAVAIGSEFLSDGAVFWEEDAHGQQVPVEVVGDGAALDDSVELVLLVDAGTASASEIVAGALQDAGRATLVGEPTFGKGTVQEWSELPDDTGGYRLSVAKWLTRGKRWIDGEGLAPDVTVAAAGIRYRPDLPGADPALDAQLQAALDLLEGRPLASPAATVAAVGG